MSEFKSIPTKATKHHVSEPSGYFIKHPTKDSLTIKRLFVNGAESREKTFNQGDSAEYDSYNLSYYGIISKITAKTVTIVDSDGCNHRLSHLNFAWRNYNFDLESIKSKNHETYQCI